MIPTVANRRVTLAENEGTCIFSVVKLFFLNKIFGVPRGGIEPSTTRLKVLRSTN